MILEAEEWVHESTMAEYLSNWIPSWQTDRRQYVRWRGDPGSFNGSPEVHVEENRQMALTVMDAVTARITFQSGISSSLTISGPTGGDISIRKGKTKGSEQEVSRNPGEMEAHVISLIWYRLHAHQQSKALVARVLAVKRKDGGRKVIWKKNRRGS